MRSGSGLRSATVTVGREAERDVLARAVEGARAGRPACVLVIGEGGVGKTRLLQDAVEVARRAGIGIAAGRPAISSPAPFSLIAEALRSWLRGHGPVSVSAPFGHGLRLVLPEWDSPGASDLSSGQLRLLALEATARLLREVAGSAADAGAGPGALLLFDDLHAADPDSIETIRYAASARVEGLAIVAALRPGESALADELVRALAGDGATTVIELEPLGRREVGDLVTHLLDAVPPAELVADVLSRTDGVPLFVEEVVDAHLRARSVVIEAGSAYWRGGSVMMPRSVRGMVTGRLERLSQQHQDVLLALAVAGSGEPPTLLQAVAAADYGAVAEALRLGIEAGLLVTSAGVIGFRHAIIREAVIDAAVPQVVATMHRRAADALDLGLAVAQPQRAALARRAAHLAAAGDGDEAAGLFAAAATRELAAHALLGAEHLARRASELAASTSTKVAAADALAAVLDAQGRWAEALEIDEATVREHGDSMDRRHRMASAALEAGYPDRARAALASAAQPSSQRQADPAQADPALAGRVLAGRLALVGGDAPAALAEIDAVLAGPADIDTRLAALDVRGRALDFLNERAAARDAWSAQVAEATAAGQTQARLRALFQLGKQEFFAGGRPALLREAAEAAATAGALLELAWVQETLAIALMLQGDPAAALEVLRDAVPRARDLHLDQLGFLLVAQAGALSFTQTETIQREVTPPGLAQPGVEELFAAAEALAPAPDLLMFTTGIRADIALQHGRYGEAVTLYENLDKMAAAMPGVAPMDGACFLTWAYAAVGQMEDARGALARAQTIPDLARWYPRPVLVTAGRALLDGDAAGIDTAIAAAAGPMPFAVASMRIIGAQVLGGQTRIRWLREAVDIYESTGATAYRGRARRLLREAGGPVPRRREPAAVMPPELASRGITTREAEVLGLLGDGLSNAEIAARLFLSVRTVETHVSSLLAKLQLRSRGQLTALNSALTRELTSAASWRPASL
ncbi:MAG TPA: AAA family ATPase [Streptosporangiaceae bacterium]|nr:AAA family ATPase [Streptosporangiaceae bacterium]